MLIQPALAHNRRIPPGYDVERRIYLPREQGKGLVDPIYSGNFQLQTGVQYDEKLMKISDAANDLRFVFDQAAASISPCLKLDEQKDRVDNDYKSLAANQTGNSIAAKFKQIESILRQAKAEFENYKSSLTGANDAYNANFQNGNKLLAQAREQLKQTSPMLDLLGRAATGAAQAALDLARMLNTTSIAKAPSIVSGSVPIYPNSNQQIPNQQVSAIPSTTAQTYTGEPSRANIIMKLSVFFEALKRRALNEVSDPTERAIIIENLKEKFVGIGEGLDEAKEDVKKLATAAFLASVRQTEAFVKNPVATMNASQEAASRFGQSFANSTIVVLDQAAKDSGAFHRLMKASIDSVAMSTHEYSKLSPKEQGKLLGKSLFWSVNPAGNLEATKLAGQAFNRAKSAIQPHMGQLQLELKMLSSATKDKLATGKEHLQTFASSIGRRNSPVPAMAGTQMTTGPPGKLVQEDLFNLMANEEKGVAQNLGKGNISRSTVKPGTKVGSVIADHQPINEGWALDGQSLAEDLKWPAGWRKPTQGEFLSSRGKLYFRPNNESISLLKLEEQTLIPFNEGVPDLLQFTFDKRNHQFIGQMTGFHAPDTSLFQKYLAENNWMNLKTQAAVKQFFIENSLAMHHYSSKIDGTHTVQLVHTKIHRYFGHHGSAYKLRNDL